MSDETLEVILGRLLTRKSLTLALAESCTGGLIANRVTDVAGSSAYFIGGVVSYANEAKEILLGVRHETLITHGAVSAETALEMARGVRERLGTDLAASVTGIAGPSGGTPGKPVGLTYVGLSAPGIERAERFVWDRDRAGNKALSADAVLRLLIEVAEGLPDPGDG
jgi:PncC family amidohydrolase